MNKLEIINSKNNKPMFFYNGKEINKPQLLNEPVTLKDGRIIAAISQYKLSSSNGTMLEKEDVKNLNLSEYIDRPKWLNNLI